MEATKEKTARTIGTVYIYIYISVFLQKNCWTVWRAIVYAKWSWNAQTRISTEKLTQESLESSKKLGFVVVQKIYIKYRNFKDGLCKKIVCPFCYEIQI